MTHWGYDKLNNIESITYFEATKSEKSCEAIMSREWSKDIYKDDKLCGPSLPTGTACQRIAGSGWVFKNPEDERYYLHGMSSSGYTSRRPSCDFLNPYYYTNVSYYYDFIKGEILFLYIYECFGCF